jgi:hypothetical protein
MEDVMRRTLLLSSLLLGALWLAAQTYPDQTQAPDRGTKTGNNQMTVEGCLSESNGNYTLTDSTGNVYRLVGGSKLSEHVGHTVKVTGTNPSHIPSSSSASSANAGATPSAPPTLTVTSVKHVSSSCSSSSR